MNDLKLMNRAADNIRILSASMVEKAKSGHPGGAMGGADFMNVLYSEYMIYDPENPNWEGRDRFFLDPGHMSAMLYSTLALTGKFNLDELKSFRQWDSPTPGHPELDVARGIENTSGPLGQGHTYAVGAAIAAKFVNAKLGGELTQKIYAFISDGGIQEEVSQGAARVAGFLGLNNLIMFYDSNDVQLSTMTDAVMNDDVAARYRAFGWKVITIKGNDTTEIRKAIEQARAEKNCPTLIIGKTVMGKGAVAADGTNFEGKCETHGMPLGACGASFEKTIANLGGDPAEPFKIFAETAELYAKRKAELTKIMAEVKVKNEAWAKANPEAEATRKRWFSGKLPDIDWSKLEQKPGQATRAASANVLAFLAKNVDNMIVASADLSNSDKTDGFLKNTKAITKDDFTGAFLQAGVAEFTMACLCVGITLYGGVVAACGTFFVFSDYMKPVARVAGLMKLPVKFIWSHDSFRVGEDGPTHQPIEHEAQIRLMEKVKNHDGKNAMLVLRPADVNEATVAWKMAMENTCTPTALLLSRQNIVNLPNSSYSNALKAEKGGYVVECDGNPDVILLASGSEVSTLVEGAAKLRADGVKVRIVSVPSEGLFRSQTVDYQNSVISPNVKVFGLTAGLPDTLLGLVGHNGKIFGLSSFGYSAPASVLDEKFGFTADNVYKQVKSFL